MPDVPAPRSPWRPNGFQKPPIFLSELLGSLRGLFLAESSAHTHTYTEWVPWGTPAPTISPLRCRTEAWALSPSQGQAWAGTPFRGRGTCRGLPGAQVHSGAGWPVGEGDREREEARAPLRLEASAGAVPEGSRDSTDLPLNWSGGGRGPVGSREPLPEHWVSNCL